MHEINKVELDEIIKSYGLKDLIFDNYKQVDPDTVIYFFHDKNKNNYCLIAADFLDNNINIPCNFEYDYYPDNTVQFRAIHIFSYINNAKKKAVDYVDDNHYLTKASTGDVCMLFTVDELNGQQ